MRVAVQQASPRRPRKKEPGQQDAGPVPLLPGTVTDDPGQRCAVHPLRDEHVPRPGDDVRDVDVRVTPVGVGEGLL